jgi:haloalkane dehalogenase
MSPNATRREFGWSALAGAGIGWPIPGQGLSFETVKVTQVDGYAMAYRELGSGAPLVFLHGNPTSSFLWRNIAPEFAAEWRCVAPDMLGMGESSKARPGEEDRYKFVGQRRLLDQVLNQLGVFDRVVLVAHDWGGVFAFDWARRHPEAVAGIVHMETFLEPIRTATTPEPVWKWFDEYRGSAAEHAVLQENQFVERVLLGQLSHLSEADRATYRAPYRRPGSDRLPTLTWPRQVPIDGVPADVHEIQEAGWHFMARSAMPKLFVNAEPGGLVVHRRKAVARSWPNTTEATVRAGHFVPEQAPAAVVAAMRPWLAQLLRGFGRG